MDTIEKKFIDGEYYVEYNLFNTVFWDNETNKRKAEILEKENKKLNIKVASLEGEIKGLNYTIEKLREELSVYDREYFDEDEKAKYTFMEEDTLQELRDLGEL